MHDKERQNHNGIQVRLFDLEKDLNFTSEEIASESDIYKNKIHVDVVPAKVYPKCSVWDDYDFVFNDELVEVDFLNSRVKIPNQKNTHLVLEKEYGPNYKIPLKKSFLGPDKNYYLAES